MLPAALAFREPFDVARETPAKTTDLRLVETTPVHPNAEKLAEQYAIQNAIMDSNIANGTKPAQYNPPAHFSARFMYVTPKFA